MSAIVDEELRVRNHRLSLAGNVSRQEKAISNQQTERVEDICNSTPFEHMSSRKSTAITPLTTTPLTSRKRNEAGADTENIGRASPTTTNHVPRSTSTAQPTNITDPLPRSTSTEFSTITRAGSSSSLLKRTLKQNNKSNSKKRANKELIRVADPWHDLIQVAIHLYFGKKVEIPMEPINLETNGDRLYQLSIYHLRKAKMTPITTTLERSRNIDYKDAFVSLSAIWNIFSENANNMFGAEKTKEVLRLLKVQEDINHPELLEITPLLLRPGSTGEELLEISYALEHEHPQRRNIIRVLQTM
ncbi:hypothetical protein EDD21DRAFT_420277 [Dissophora ornata]|nr:hypothetical protein EDD21DRAFT_420277 [Dissophora ornata]